MLEIIVSKKKESKQIALVENKSRYFYDYIVINDKLDIAVKEIERIINNKIIDNK